MKVLKYQLKIKVDDFTTYSGMAGVEEISERSLGNFYSNVATAIKADPNMWWEEVERAEDRVIDTPVRRAS